MPTNKTPQNGSQFDFERFYKAIAIAAAATADFSSNLVQIANDLERQVTELERIASIATAARTIGLENELQQALGRALIDSEKERKESATHAEPNP